MQKVELSHCDDKPGFKKVHIYTDERLGIGSYGHVCMAKCDDLSCAAKYLHSSIFDPSSQRDIAHEPINSPRRKAIKNFEQEIEILKTFRHPNIIQYLGTTQLDGTLVLLMELMPENLTNFLERCQGSLPYHSQFNICYDISLAMSFLHSNSLTHRDLSSNNVLLLGQGIRAKVTDFGIARLDLQKHTRLLSRKPGTDVYMPPEAFESPPIYTEKLDCFSFGVLVLQIMTQLPPDPTPSFKRIGESDQFQRFSEIERRQNHIDKIDPKYPLLAIAIDCLHDKDKRPAANQICERLDGLKGQKEYSYSLKASQKSSAHERDSAAQKITLSQKDVSMSNQELRQKLHQVMQQNKEKQKIIAERDREIKMKEKKIDELEKELKKLQSASPSRHLPQKSTLKLKWKEGKEVIIPRDVIHRSENNAIVDGDIVYVIPSTKGIYAFNSSKDLWSKLPICPCDNCSIAIVQDVLTTIGGCPTTNQLFSLVGQGDNRQWIEKFPPMLTERYCTVVVCTKSDLIVAGGKGEGGTFLTAVEIMNIKERMWSTAASLPKPQYNASATICDDCIYIVGGENTPKTSMFTCSLPELIKSCNKSPSTGRQRPRSMSLANHYVALDTDVWNEVTNLPFTESTCLTFNHSLLTVGGKESNKPTTAIRMYDPISKSWEIISNMTTARSHCYAAILSTNLLIIVGGKYTTLDHPQTVELAEIDNIPAVPLRSYTNLQLRTT